MYIIIVGCLGSQFYILVVTIFALLFCIDTNRLWDDPFPWMVRLQDGPFSSEGLVEVYCNGVWNKVCGGSSFSVNDADTVCLQLGYKGSGDITEV